MTHTGILFSRPMVHALKAGTKRETRRVINPQPPVMLTPGGLEMYPIPTTGPYGPVDGLLYVKETVMPAERTGGRGVLYAADFSPAEVAQLGKRYGGWKPSIFTRETEARLWYKLAAQRTERLTRITGAGAQAEGVEAVDGSYIAAYRALWNKINAGWKPVKAMRARPGKGWTLSHYVSYPFDGPGDTTRHKRLPAYIYPNPLVYVLTLEPASIDTATP